MPLSTDKDFVARSKRVGNRPTIRRMLETTPARVAVPNAPSAVEEPIPDEDLGWTPLDLPRAIRSRRTYRIPVILIALAVAAGAYFAAQFALRLPLAHAEGQREAYAEALSTALDEMPDLRAAAAGLTAQDLGDGFATHLTTLVRLEGVTAQLRTAADVPTLLRIPGLPDQDFEILEPIRDRMDAIADRMIAVGGLLTDVATYHMAFDDMFLLPALPGPSEGPSVEILSDRLSQMTAATVEAAALLPDSELFSDHRSQVEALIEWLPEWQAAYLDALRDDNLDWAADLRDQADAHITQLRTDLAGPLDAAAAWTSSTITQLTLDIQAALVLTA